jgi:hypothetical protein
MKYKSIAVVLITVLLFMILGSSSACTTPVTEYVLDISSTEGGSVTEPGEGKYPYCPEQGERVNLVATPDTGYRFVNWTGDVDTIANVDSATTTITVNGDYSITANFEEIPDHDGEIPDHNGEIPDHDGEIPDHDGEIPDHDINICSTSGGAVNDPGEGTFTYDEGTVLDLVAEADEGYLFVNWTGDVGTIADINAAITTITINNDYSITANFEEIVEYELNISSIGGGSVTTPGEGTFIYSEGDEVNLVATPNAGYIFINWIGDVGTIADVNAANTTITMNGDYAITAYFLDP